MLRVYIHHVLDLGVVVEKNLDFAFRIVSPGPAVKQSKQGSDKTVVVIDKRQRLLTTRSTTPYYICNLPFTVLSPCCALLLCSQ